MITTQDVDQRLAYERLLQYQKAEINASIQQLATLEKQKLEAQKELTAAKTRADDFEAAMKELKAKALSSDAS